MNTERGLRPQPSVEAGTQELKAFERDLEFNCSQYEESDE
jgi:hypothetical protein